MSKTKLYQLALQGGGAKGSYHIGFVKALYEEGYRFNAIVGTSIGAMNAAIIAQGDLDKAYELWNNIKFSDVLDVDDKHAKRLAEKEYKVDTITYAIKKLTKVIISKGFKTDKIEKIIKENIDEEKLRKSKINFGLLTVKSSNNKLVPLYLFKKDIPNGMLNDYILASARLPVFQKLVINNEEHIDGGIYDNLPVNMLLKKGYKNIIALKIDATSIAKVQKVDKKYKEHVTYIQSSEKPGRTLDFTRKSIKKGINIGYYDGKRFALGLYGTTYYITPFNKEKFLDKLYKNKSDILDEIENILNIQTIKDLDKTRRYVKITDELQKLLNSENNSLVDLLIELAESIAIKLKINRFQILTLKELYNQITLNIKEEEILNFKNKEKKQFDFFIAIKKYI